MESNRIESIARAIIIRDDAVLVCQVKGKDYYFFPGGHIEFGESAEQALVRELKEESGLDLTVGEYIGSLENIFTQDGIRRHEYNFVFRGSLPTAKVVSIEDHSIFAWIPITKLPTSRVLPERLKEQVVQWLDDTKTFWDTQVEER